MADIHEKKFSMFNDGPTVLQLKKLYDRVDELKRMVLEDNNTFSTRYLPPFKDSQF